MLVCDEPLTAPRRLSLTSKSTRPALATFPPFAAGPSFPFGVFSALRKPAHLPRCRWRWIGKRSVNQPKLGSWYLRPRQIFSPWLISTPRVSAHGRRQVEPARVGDNAASLFTACCLQITLPNVPCSRFLATFTSLQGSVQIGGYRLRARPQPDMATKCRQRWFRLRAYRGLQRLARLWRALVAKLRGLAEHVAVARALSKPRSSPPVRSQR